MSHAGTQSDSSFSELRPLVPDEPVAQGDIIRRRDQSCDEWMRLGIVVTADCDIAFHKHSGVLTYVPVVPANTYLETYWMPKRLERLQTTMAGELHSAVVRHQEANLPAFSKQLSLERVKAWVLESAPQEIAETLCIDNGARSDFIDLVIIYQAVTRAKSKPFLEQCESEIEARVHLRRQKTREAAIDVIRKDYLAFVRSMPGDCLFLSGIDDDLSRGHVCYLRLLREVRQDDIALNVRRAHRTRPFERVARLRSPYVYRLTQLLGSVFSSIGLPAEYEQARDTCTLDELPGIDLKSTKRVPDD